MKKRHFVMELFAVILSFLLAMPGSLVSVALAEETTTTRVKHKKPKEKYIPGFRIKLAAEVKDKVGVLLSRCYFKTKKDKNFGFVDMFHVEDEDYRVTLPAPWLNSEAVEYLFVVVNNEKKVTRTQIFTIEEEETKEAIRWKESGDIQEVRLDKAQEVGENYKEMKRELEKYRKKRPDYQAVEGQEAIVVKTDLIKPQIDLFGFHDNAILVEVPNNLKYGLLAKDLYAPAVVAAAGGETAASAATGATSAGTIAASTGVGAGAIVGIGLGVAALGAGAAAVVISQQEEEEEEEAATPPPGSSQCNETVTSGGDAPETRSVFLGKKSGTFLFTWNMVSIKDRMVVIYEGKTLFDTGCVAGTGSKSISYSGNSTSISVSVTPNCGNTKGTFWEFKVGCP